MNINTIQKSASSARNTALGIMHRAEIAIGSRNIAEQMSSRSINIGVDGREAVEGAKTGGTPPLHTVEKGKERRANAFSRWHS